MLKLTRNQPLIVLFIILANIALSAGCIYFDPVVNDDATRYLALAELFKTNQWQAAFDLSSWPLYSFLISIVASLFHVNNELAAYLLNFFLVTSLTLAYVSIVNEFSNGNKSILIIAAVIVLMLPSVNKYRPFITRDFGYLSCYLWSLFFLFRYSRDGQTNHLAAWFLLGIFSCLFRLEGILFVILIPCFLCFWNSTRVRQKSVFFALLIILILLCMSSIIFWFLSTKYASIFHQLRTSQLHFPEALDLFLQDVSNRSNSDHPVIFTFIQQMFVAVLNVSYETLRRLAFFYFFIAIYAYQKRLAPLSIKDWQIWKTYLVINFVLLCLFAFISNYFVSRYAMALVLTILIFAPFTLHYLLKNIKSLPPVKKGFSYLLIALLCLASIGGLQVKTDKKYIKNAGQWLAQNTPEHSKIYSNNILIPHYASKDPYAALYETYNNVTTIKYIRDGSIKEFDYVALQANLDNYIEANELQGYIEYFGEPVYVSKNMKNSQVAIFKAH